MKKISLIILSGLLMSALFAQERISRAQYIATYSPIAIKNMKETGIPASITMAQAILESGDGNSDLAKNANNHFGIKCHSEWTGKKQFQDDDTKNECFRVYKKAEESFADHSAFLTSRSRYAFLFELEKTDYKAWAEGLKKAGYATNPNYPKLLIKIIEDNNLFELDKGVKINKTSENQTNTALVITEISTGAYTIKKTKNETQFVIAKGGESPKQLAKALQMREWQIAKYNDVDKKHQFSANQKVLLQPKRLRGDEEEHVVKSGETLWSISQMHSVKLKSLKSFNNIKSDEELVEGRVLQLRHKPRD